MRIAIIGMGVAGAYLGSRLHEEHEVVCFERLPEKEFDAVCAWGTSKHGISEFAVDCGLDFEDYVIQDGKTMYLEIPSGIQEIPLRGLCTFDKKNFVKDMMKGCNVNYSSNIGLDFPKNDYDLVIDSTASRRLLPHLDEQMFIPCIQYLVEYDKTPYDDFYIRPLPDLTGYFWYFPLGKHHGHVGAGDSRKNHVEAVNDFVAKYPGKVQKKVGRPIRITPPSRCQPFRDGNVIGVGEAIGSVYPMLGEGIIPSLQCARILAKNLEDFPKYRAGVLKEFKIYDAIYKFIKNKISGSFNPILDMPKLITLYKHMKQNQSRYGMEV
ncbi:MAG: NAD(P)/FAD-dependent oxidoreductase, partial [Nitrososphaerales archaeon]